MNSILVFVIFISLTEKSASSGKNLVRCPANYLLISLGNAYITKK